MYFNGLKFIVSIHAVEATAERLFPASKNRSRRIHKKLVKRFGGEFVHKPCAYRLPDNTVVIHPALYAQIRDVL